LSWDKSLVALAIAWPKLNKLSLCGMQLSEKGLADALRQCAALEYLEVWTHCQLLPMEAAVPSLKSFKTRSRYMSDAELVAIGQKCAKLKTLDIFPFTDSTGEYPVTDVGALAVLQGCPLLQKTDIMLTAAISNELRVELSRRCDFKRLNLFSWRGMAEELAQEVLKVSPGLLELLLHQCDRLTDVTLAVCAQHC
jgi:hypothetical protein